MLRAQIESGMLDLDGPELLQYAMMLVQGALTKSQASKGIQSKCLVLSRRC